MTHTANRITTTTTTKKKTNNSVASFLCAHFTALQIFCRATAPGGQTVVLRPSSRVVLDTNLRLEPVLDRAVAALAEAYPDGIGRVLGHVVVAGGTSMLPGFDARVCHTLEAAVNNAMAQDATAIPIVVLANPQPDTVHARTRMAWRGAAILSLTPGFARSRFATADD